MFLTNHAYAVELAKMYRLALIFILYRVNSEPVQLDITCFGFSI